MHEKHEQQDTEYLYREIILDLVKHPLNKKQLADFDIEFDGHNPLCGDTVSIRVKCDETGRITDIGHTGDGCAISQAVTSLLTDAVKGKTLEEIATLTEEDLVDIVGFSVMYTRQKCFTLALSILQRRR